MSLDLLRQKLKNENIFGVFLLCGADEYTKEFYADEIRKKATATFPELNYHIFDAEKNNLSDLAASIEVFPLMAATKLIEVKNFHIDNISEEMAKELAEIIKQIPDFSNLLFYYRDEEMDIKKISPRGKGKGAAAFIDTIKEYGIVVEFATPSNQRLESWAKRHFESNETPIKREHLRYLIEYCGEDMHILASEINKLCMFCQNREVGKEDIENICCPNITYRIFDMTNALTAGDDEKAFEIFNSLKFSKIEPIILLGTLAKFISDMAIIKSGLDSNLSLSTIARASSIKEWQIKRQLSYLQKSSGSFFVYAANECLEADKRLKSSAEEPYIVLETLITRISSYGK